MGDKVTTEKVVGTHLILGMFVQVQRITWRDDPGLSFDLLDGQDACLTDESWDEYPTAEQMEAVVRAQGPWMCLRCHRGTGPGYHLAGGVAPGANPYVCDDCWDERLR